MRLPGSSADAENYSVGQYYNNVKILFDGVVNIVRTGGPEWSVLLELVKICVVLSLLLQYIMETRVPWWREINNLS